MVSNLSQGLNLIWVLLFWYKIWFEYYYFGTKFDL